MKTYLTFRSMTAALAIGSMLAVTLVPVSASAGRYGGYHRGHYHHHHHGGSKGGDIAIGLLGGLLVGAAIMSAAQPRTYAPAPAYAPYGGGYGYGGYGAVDATPASEVYRAPNGQYCRDYTSASGYGTACLGGDGVWRTVN